MEPQQQVTPQAIPFQFTGTSGEYFRIWIVNIFLSLITLGIYSAWAKVRRNRYFYGNTRIAGAGFDYLATPRMILRGRLIAFAALLVYLAAQQILPLLALILQFVFVGALPWLIVNSLRFRARNTAYRNLRFGFNASYGNALILFVLLPLLIVVTFGLAYPFVLQRQKEFIVGNSRYGTTHFSFRGKVREFYGAIMPAVLIALGGVLAVVWLLEISPLLSGITGAALYFVLIGYFVAAIGNLTYNRARLGEHAFRSDLRAVDLAWIYFTNTVGVALTLGLFLPWAQIRLARYRAAHLNLLPAGELENFIQAEAPRVASTGEELGEMFDVDVSL